MAMPSARPTKTSARPAVSGFSATAPIAAAPTTATAYAAPSAETPEAMTAARNPQRTTSGDTTAAAVFAASGAASKGTAIAAAAMGTSATTLHKSRLRMTFTPRPQRQWRIRLAAAAEEFPEELVVLEAQHLHRDREP